MEVPTLIDVSRKLALLVNAMSGFTDATDHVGRALPHISVNATLNEARSLFAKLNSGQEQANSNSVIAWPLPDGGVRGVVAPARKAFDCYGAGARHGQRHEVPAGTEAFRFTRVFYYSGAKYGSGVRCCIDHAITMGLVRKGAA